MSVRIISCCLSIYPAVTVFIFIIINKKICTHYMILDLHLHTLIIIVSSKLILIS